MLATVSIINTTHYEQYALAKHSKVHATQPALQFAWPNCLSYNSRIPPPKENFSNFFRLLFTILDIYNFSHRTKAGCFLLNGISFLFTIPSQSQGVEEKIDPVLVQHNFT